MREKKRIRIVSVIILCGILVLGGCQKTPDKSAVASKAGGLSKEVIADPLKKGKTLEYELPAQWKKSEKRSSDRVTINVDLPMQSFKAGNLPVVEVKNHTMTQKELEKLVEYFSDGKPLFLPQVRTKADYQRQKDRIDNKEGAYADPVLWTVYTDWSDYMGDAVKLAPEEQSAPETAKVKFQKSAKTEDFYASYGGEVPERNKEDLFFSADVGENRESRIKAERYDEKVENASIFSWKTGSYILTEEELIFERARNNSFASYTEEYGDTYKYAADFQTLQNTIETAMQVESIAPEEGQKQAEQLLKDLDIQEMSVASSQRLLWFPQGVIQDEELIAGSSDALFQLDLEKGETGYEYTFSRTVAGMSVNQFFYSTVLNNTEDTYNPPFDVETVKVTVTESGIKSFEWEAMSEEVSKVAENTKLLPFADIETTLFDQIYYRYADMGQPAESQTNFIYSVSEARLGYTYVTAYGEPSHAWLVPAWFFTINTHVDDKIEMGVEYDQESQEYMLNALDGGLIAFSMQ